jgi:hypothetical protein
VADPIMGMHITGVHLMAVHLIDVHLVGVHLMGVYLRGVHLMGVYLTGRAPHFIDVYFMDVYMFPNPKKLWGKPLALLNTVYRQQHFLGKPRYNMTNSGSAPLVALAL